MRKEGVGISFKDCIGERTMSSVAGSHFPLSQIHESYWVMAELGDTGETGETAQSLGRKLQGAESRLISCFITLMFYRRKFFCAGGRSFRRGF